MDTIKRAIDNLDTVLVSLEDLIYRYGEEVYSTIISYFMKFGDENS